jgi:hypothetical protein
MKQIWFHSACESLEVDQRRRGGQRQNRQRLAPQCDV